MAISHIQPLLLLLLLVSLFVLPALSVSFSNCNSPNEYPVNVTTVKISPYPVKRSTNGNITITGYTSKYIPDGVTVNLELYTFVLISKKTYSLCDVTACPVATGPFVITLPNVFTPKELKSAGYGVTVIINEENVRDPMMCIVFACKIKGAGNHNFIEVKTVEMSPDPVKRSSKDIADGATVNLGLSIWFPVSTKRYSLCDVTACPVVPGPFVITLSNILTDKEKKRPRGYNVVIAITEKDLEDEPVMCVMFAFVFKRGYASLLSQVTG
ncbi:unnamed protein product [Thlaspi arvense]|uniref:MD-2-related lipid-recognition domain-containing protein n=1 Tax=Thlaspi arvense TaxID=13288 RepID=A0AAU9S2I6_THLAR|nr:unnamed protein product [Thlaspi arvense]